MKNMSSLVLFVLFSSTVFATGTPTAHWEYVSAIQKNLKAEVSWKVFCDRPVSYFNIEQFSLSGEWEVIGTVRATAQDCDYHFTDVSPLFGQNHYRIVLYDTECIPTISNVVTLNFSDAVGFALYDNASANGKVKVILPAASRICIFNSDGSEVYCMPFAAGVQYVDLSNLKKGNYKIRNAGVVKELSLK